MKLEWQQSKTFSQLNQIYLITAKNPFKNYIHTHAHGAFTVYIFGVGSQLDAQFLLRLFESSTCFEQLCAHLQEDNCINP